MKTRILSVIAVFGLLASLTGCHDPEKVVSNGDENGILSLTGNFVNEEIYFTSEIDHTARTITMVFPYNYPEESDNLMDVDALKAVQLRASMSNNSIIEPALGTWDLTKEHKITITNHLGVKHVYTLKGEIRKNNACDIMELTIPDAALNGIVNHDQATVTLITTDQVGTLTGEYKLSPHATLVPDIAVEPFDFDAEDAKLTVVAQDGVTKKEYTIIKGEPTKLLSGMRPGSEKLLWVKKLADIGCVKRNIQAGIGVTDDYVVINEKGMTDAVVLSTKDGSVVTRMNLSTIPTNMNHSMTSDDAGHIIVNSYGNEGTFYVWVYDNIDAQPRAIITQGMYGVGQRVSVIGDVTKDAVIVAPVNGTSLDFYRWAVKDGVVGNYELVHLNGVTSSVWGNADIAPTSATNPNADYYAVFYAQANGTRAPFCYNGSTNSMKYAGLWNTEKNSLDDAGNWIMNACDFKEFNRAKFFFYNSVNTFSWGTNDLLYLMDVSGSNLTTHAVDFSDTGMGLNGNYGGKAGGTKGQAGNANDMRLWVSSDGYYMYCYFMFTNGYIGCVRVDCIDQ